MLIKEFFQHALSKVIISTTIWNTVGKGIGVFIPFFIGAWFGVNIFTDIFFFVYAVIFYLSNILSISIESNIVPYIAKVRQENKEKADAFLGRILSLNLIAVLTITILFFIVLLPVLKSANNFPASQRPLIMKMFFEMWPFFIFVVFSSIMSGILNAYFKFWLPAVSPAIRAAICLIVMFLFKDKIGVHSVAVGYVAGEVIRLAVFISYILKNKISALKLTLGLDQTVKDFIKTVLIQITSLTIIGLNPIIDNIMASWLDTGSVSILQYAYRIYFIPTAFVMSGFAVVLLSRWSEKFYEHKDMVKFSGSVHKAIKVVVIVSVFLTLGFIIFSKPIVEIGYSRGKFPESGIALVRATLIMYLFGLCFELLAQIIARAHLVLNKMKVLASAAAISSALNIFFNYIFMKTMGIKGIALSTSITNVITCGYLYLAFRPYSKPLKKQDKNA